MTNSRAVPPSAYPVAPAQPAGFYDLSSLTQGMYTKRWRPAVDAAVVFLNSFFFSHKSRWSTRNFRFIIYSIFSSNFLVGGYCVGLYLLFYCIYFLLLVSPFFFPSPKHIVSFDLSVKCLYLVGKKKKKKRQRTNLWPCLGFIDWYKHVGDAGLVYHQFFFI